MAIQCLSKLRWHGKEWYSLGSPSLENIIVRILQRNGTNRMSTERLKELVYVIVGAGKFNICRVGWRHKEELTLQPKPNGSLETEFPLPWEISVFSS